MEPAIATKSPEDTIQSEIERLLYDGVQMEAFASAVSLVSVRGDILGAFAFGQRWPEVDPSTVSFETAFDIGSLTQILCSTAIIMRLVDEGRLDLNHKVSRYLPGFNVHGKSIVTIGHLLSHTAGLEDTHPFYEEIAQDATGKRLGLLTSRGARDVIINSIARGQLNYEPETKQVFSDLGFILLGYIIELLTGLPLEKAFARYVAQPLGMKNTGFIDLALVRRRSLFPLESRIAPTGECPWRAKSLCGEVYDENAWIMGGVSGHAGLFATIGDIHAFCNEMWQSASGNSEFLSKKILMQFWEGAAQLGLTKWRFGWESPNRENGFINSGFSERSLGHASSTGCSLWLEPELGAHVILLTNALFPAKNNRKIDAFREEFHRAILRVLR